MSRSLLRGAAVRQLTILSGAGINLGLREVCPGAAHLFELAYSRVSAAVYQRLPGHVQNIFPNPDSFDAILGGLITVNLAIERTKLDMRRFGVDENAFADLFHQTTVQETIIHALDAIEQQLRIPLDQMLAIMDTFAPAINALFQRYDSINYYTVNFDAIFDHILYGRYNGGRMHQVTDFWGWDGNLTPGIARKAKIFHMHGDLRYKPFKQTTYNNPPSKWPVLVVGDNQVKLQTIAQYDALQFYNQRFRETCANRGPYNVANDLAIIGFGFRDEDDHIRTPLWEGMVAGVFGRIAIFDMADHLGRHTPFPTNFTSAENSNLLQFFESLAN